MSSPNIYELDKKEFALTRRIMLGGFNNVYEIKDKVKNQIYAAKALNKNEYDESTILQEIKIRAKAQHQTIINKFIGYINYNQSYVLLIMEIPSFFSLYTIFNHPSSKITTYDNTARQIILIGLSYCLKYLHKLRIPHLSLTPECVLLDQHFYPQITDFEFEGPRSCNYPYPIYLAPEYFKSGTFNSTSYVYSFSLIMYQIFTGNNPFPQLSSEEFKNAIVNNFLRPQIPPSMKQSFADLLRRCWSNNLNERPKLDEIYQNLAYNSEFYLNEINYLKVFNYFLNVLKDPQAQSPISSPIRDSIENESRAIEKLKNVKISEFNSFPSKMQHKVIDVIIRSSPEQTRFGHIFDLLNYFLIKLKANCDYKFIEIITNEPNSKLIDSINLNQIYLLFNSTLL